MTEPSGKSYDISTWPDLVACYRDLPEDRRPVLMKELEQSLAMIDTQATVADLLGTCLTVERLTWIDDDNGEGTVNYLRAAGEEPFATVNIKLEDAA